MDPNQETENTDIVFDLDEGMAEGSVSVDDFLRELEEKEKDLHITSETTFIELAADFENEDEIPDFIRQELPKAGAAAAKPSAAPSTAADPAAVRKLEGEIATLRARIAGLEDERSELHKDAQRRLKDFEAYKARTERERRETFQRQLANLATEMLPALDNLDRALQFAAGIEQNAGKEFSQFFDGIVLVNQQVNEVLSGMGVTAIPAIGEAFDPHYHEAVAIDETSDTPANTVTGELLRGFCIGEKVIRHSMVKVSKGQISGAKPEEDPAGAGDVQSTPSSSEPQMAEAQTEEFAIERNGEIE